MTTTYSADELSAIATAPMVVGLAVAVADMGLVSTALEAAALSKQMLGAAQKYPNNSIIQSAFSETAIRSGAVKFEMPDIKAEDVQAGMTLNKAMDAINAAITMLEGKATADEIQAYKAFIYACGEAVANAAGSGLWGKGNPKVSDNETKVLTQLKSALGV
jgi:hypothetical protein